MSSITGTKVQGRAQSKLLNGLMSLFATVVCLGFPAVWTIMAPLSYVSLSYDGEVVSASVTRFVYLIVPYRTDRLSEVTAVDTVYRGSYTDYDGTGRRNSEVEAQATLVLSGPDGQVSAMVPPESLTDLKVRTQGFVANPTRDGMGFVAVASWVFSLFFGALVSSIVWLLAGSAVYRVVMGLWRGARRLTGRA